MPKGILFWVLMVLWVVLGAYFGRSDWRWGGAALLLFFLLFLLGWQVFGFIVQ